MGLKIMQGDQYAIVFTGSQDGKPLDMSTIDEIEFTVDRLRKTYPGDVTQDEDGNFLFPLTQEETFAIQRSSQHVQIRVKFKGGATPTVIGVDVGDISVADSISKVVL